MALTILQLSYAGQHIIIRSVLNLGIIKQAYLPNLQEHYHRAASADSLCIHFGEVRIRSLNNKKLVHLCQS